MATCGACSFADRIRTRRGVMLVTGCEVASGTSAREECELSAVAKNTMRHPASFNFNDMTRRDPRRCVGSDYATRRTPHPSAALATAREQFACLASDAVGNHRGWAALHRENQSVREGTRATLTDV